MRGTTTIADMTANPSRVGAVRTAGGSTTEIFSPPLLGELA
jgi:hypothetical protein